ncbi:hypothetical protein CfE428DRAFT_6631 [Chthoniobacter flavus Ellin428]|uniref:Cadherin-like beta-sandwich-like domain-containing protein n=1 Tax=Chthoniobacter flavus Ellin428 TaxID=497964 RepID=B4DCJ0_9BACT|nr:hypothetical protein CfE428DRAFT_6631 [Chthoniobacter flavus Ellin428]
MKFRGMLFLIALAGIGLSASRADDSILHSFSTADGAPAVYGSLVLGQGVLYGMTGNGGGESVGTIFRVNADGSGYAVLHSFTNDGISSDGASPLSSLTLVGSVLYGMTPVGGIVPPVGPPPNGGTVFRINTDGTGFQVLHGFTGSQLSASNDGGTPYGAVTVSGSKIYGMTRFGGTSTRGTIFSLNTDGTGFQVLHSFTETANDGAVPEGSLTLIGSKLYGLTNAGGDNDEGTVFSINTDGSDFAVLHSFGTFDSGEAVEPIGGNGLTLVGSTLYGVSFNGGAAQNGAIFSLNPDGSNFQMLHSFDGSDGSGPYGSLALSGSQLYGTTSGFGVTVSSGTGTVFGMSLDGSAFTLLQTFAGGPNDGLLGLGTPAVSPDGSLLYGLTQYGGTAENGTIFSMTASGSLTNANLFNLAPSAGVLDTAFNSSNTRYTVYVVEGVSAITITPTPADAGATITVNGSPVAAGAPSTPINLTTGANVIDTIVTARDGVTTNLYTLTVIRLTPLQTWRWNLLGTPTDVGNARQPRRLQRQRHSEPGEIRLRAGPDFARGQSSPTTDPQRRQSRAELQPTGRPQRHRLRRGMDALAESAELDSATRYRFGLDAQFPSLRRQSPFGIHAREDHGVALADRAVGQGYLFRQLAFQSHRTFLRGMPFSFRRFHRTEFRDQFLRRTCARRRRRSVRFSQATSGRLLDV